MANWLARRAPLGLVVTGLVIVVAVNVLLIVTAPRPWAHVTEQTAPSAPSASVAPTVLEVSELPPLVGAKHAAEEELPPPPETASAAPKVEPVYRTVMDAAARSCTTAAVDGLSKQIIAQSRCIDAGAFVPLPSRPNVKAAGHVVLYFDRAARDQLTAVLDEHPDQDMTVNSALRTVAQQYLLKRWSEQKRCGVQLATAPGDSNHETGLALDIRETKVWKRSLEAHGFRWLGAKDRVHFDYRGKRASSRSKVDVIAFQQLWNQNNPDDRIPETGRYSAALEARLKKAPASGFEIGPKCAAGASDRGRSSRR